MRVTGFASLGRRHYLSVALRTDEPCRATLTGRVGGAGSLRSATARLTPGTRTVVRMRVADARALRRALRSRARTVAIRVEVVDAAGNTRALTQSARASKLR